MFRATVKGLLAHKLRLFLTAMAVVLGASFVAGTFALTDTTSKTFDTFFTEVAAGYAVSLRAASYAERVVFLGDGRIVDEMTAPTADRVLDRMKIFGD